MENTYKKDSKQMSGDGKAMPQSTDPAKVQNEPGATPKESTKESTDTKTHTPPVQEPTR